MGAEQSSGTGLRSQRDEDIPYSSFSISRPIDGGTPRNSPRLTKSRTLPSRPEPLATMPAPGKHDIVVVAEGSRPIEDDAELKRLENIPVFLPVIRTSLNSTVLTEMDTLACLDHRQLLLLGQRYQDHLRQCAEAVSFDQNALCVRIKEVDFAVNAMYASLSEQRKKFAKYAEQVNKVQEMSSTLNRVKMNMQQTVSIMEQLNAVLPPEEQLEPFTLNKLT